MTAARSFVEALAAYTEARAELTKALDAYEGYSPSYAFAWQIEERARLEQEANASLVALVKTAVIDALAATAPAKEQP